MIKLLLILLVGLTFESAGVVLLKKGMTHIGDMNGITASEILRVCKAGATNPQILAGIFFEALFFGCLLILMSKSDISFLWPLTGLSFVFATFAAIWFLNERVSAVRWIGVVLVVLGAAFISYSQHVKEKPAPPQTNSIQR
jgi:drug/metabolite transporter (DMT)-like permease